MAAPVPSDGGSGSLNGEDTYDYVIVGAGPSCAGLLHGLFVAQQQPDNSEGVVDGETTGGTQWEQRRPLHLRVAVLERGPLRSSRDHVPPRDWFRASHSSNFRSQFDAEEPVAVINEGTTARGRRLTVPVGQGLDGTAQIHAALCLPPCRDDLTAWPEPFRSHLLDACQRLQDALHRNGALSEIPTCCVDAPFPSPPPPAGSSSERPPIEWAETTFPSLPASIPMTVYRSSASVDAEHTYHRSSYWDGLLGSPSISPSSLEAVTLIRGHAERLLFAEHDEKERRVLGVEYRIVGGLDGSTDLRRLYATRDVILCAGALETPALCLVSGIGCSDGDGLPVGQCLRDHAVLSRAVWRRWPGKPPGAAPPSSANGLLSLRQMQIDGERFQIGVFEGQAYGDILPQVVAGWFHWRLSGTSSWLATLLNCGSSAVYHLLRRSLSLLLRAPYSPFYWLLRRYVATVSLFLLNPTSTGRVRIRRRLHVGGAASSTEDPRPLRRSDVELNLSLGFADTEADLVALRKGWIASEVLPESMGVEVFPGALVWKWEALRWLRRSSPAAPLDEARFRWFCHATCLPYFHWCGSCRIGTTSDDGVVDAALRVRGCAGIRICDASVFPTTISAPTALTCAGLGYLMGTKILHG